MNRKDVWEISGLASSTYQEQRARILVPLAYRDALEPF